MLLAKLVRRLAPKPSLARAIIGGILAATIVSVTTIAIANLLGYPVPPGVAGALGAACGCSYVAGHR